jgi:hypothetical protein
MMEQKKDGSIIKKIPKIGHFPLLNKELNK